MDKIVLPPKIRIGDKTLVFPDEEFIAYPGDDVVFVLDFNRRFEDPDLTSFPAKAIRIETKQQRYMLERYGVILGVISDYDQNRV